MAVSVKKLISTLIIVGRVCFCLCAKGEGIYGGALKTGGKSDRNESGEVVKLTNQGKGRTLD